MKSKYVVLGGLICVFLSFFNAANALAYDVIELQTYKQEHSSVTLKAGRLGEKAGISVVFTGTDDLHYYAKKETAGGGYNLTIKAEAAGMTFGETIFGAWGTMVEPATNKTIEIFVGDFAAFVPVESYGPEAGTFDVTVSISGLACTSKICLMPFTKELPPLTLDTSKSDSWPVVTVGEQAASTQKIASKSASYSAPIAFALAILAGLILNVMPCVWPVLPIIVTRLWNEAGEKRSRSITLGLAFSAGILCFFAAIAALNLILLFGYDRVFQWGDQFRSPVFLTVMGLLMVVLGLFMFGIFNIGIPASVTGKAGSGKGLTGAVGMGFLAALLATPCGFAVLAAAVAWAQTQHWAVATFTLMLIGVGMAIPYLILVCVPGLLNKLPKPGAWMEHIKHAMGFLLLLIAVKMIMALPDEMKSNVLVYAVILSFCTWMWGCWVVFSTPFKRKVQIRVIAVVLAVVCGFGFLASDKEAHIDWQPYDATVIQAAKESGQGVLIKFTADWCTTCAIVDKLVYQRKDIVKLVERKGLLAIKADTTTAEMKATIDLSSVYNEPAVPVTIILLPDGGEKHLPGFIKKEDVREVLEGLPDVPAGEREENQVMESW
ncbi:MAG TPA: DUF255 domain-containing protein [Phycisphaerales bacterium]|nr:DUF255 domain-containing protein [Phycisphaerales bacterium]